MANDENTATGEVEKRPRNATPVAAASVWRRRRAVPVAKNKPTQPQPTHSILPPTFPEFLLKGFYRVLPCDSPFPFKGGGAGEKSLFFNGFYLGFIGFHGFYRVSVGFTGFYWVSMGFTGFD